MIYCQIFGTNLRYVRIKGLETLNFYGKVMKKLIILLGIVLMPMIAEAQVAKFKAMFTLNFIRYIGWPETAKQGDFVVGVVRDKELADWLRDQSAGKKFGFQDVVIKEFRSAEEVVDCQVVYISGNVNYAKYAGDIANKVKKETLIITEAEGATTSGSMINFVVRDEKLKFELHKGNAAKSGIQFSSKMETMTNAINL